VNGPQQPTTESSTLHQRTIDRSIDCFAYLSVINLSRPLAASKYDERTMSNGEGYNPIHEDEDDLDASLLQADHEETMAAAEEVGGVMDPERPSIYDETHEAFLGGNHDQHQNFYGNNFYITIPWSPQVYFSVRGAENFHIYLWIAKDLAWTRNSYMPAMIFGILALCWCAVLMYHAITARCLTEVYMLIIMIIWLAANFLWMSGKCSLFIFQMSSLTQFDISDILSIDSVIS
jgi:hypothetical protein